MNPRSAGLALALLVLAASIEAPARAGPEGDKAASDRLFHEGLAKMLAGSFDVGCPKLAESQRLYPRPGTLFTLAECEAKAGQFVSSLAHYQEYLQAFSRMDADQQALQRRKERDTIAAAQIEALSRDVPRLTITAPAHATAGLLVELDGAPLEPSRIGLELPVDPGEHVIEWRPREGEPARRTITLALRERRTITLGMGDATEGEPDAPDAPAAPGASGQRIAAFTLGGIGLAGIALGAVSGGLALAEKGTIEDRCADTGVNDTWRCDAAGKEAADNAQDLLAPMSTIAFGVGAAALTAGLVLFFTEPEARVAPDLAVGPGGGSIGLRGTW